MDLEEFETLYREEMETVLNRLQTVMLTLVDLENKTLEIGRSLQDLSISVEKFVVEYRQRDSEG
ncbi:MAG: hypothetical protein VKK04_01635 [Synechococcales bacterium]|nr:hypothetical protein [Synechococcales bacterium]